MSFHRNPVARAFLVASAFWLIAAAPQSSGAQQAKEVPSTRYTVGDFAYSIPKNWKRAFSSEAKDNSIVDYVPSSQTAGSWYDKITVVASVNKAKASVKSVSGFFASQFKKECQRSEVKPADMPKELEARMSVVFLRCWLPDPDMLPPGTMAKPYHAMLGAAYVEGDRIYLLQVNWRNDRPVEPADEQAKVDFAWAIIRTGRFK